MGLDINGVRFLLYAMKLGANYSSIVTMGRQELYSRQDLVCDQFDRYGVTYSGAFKQTQPRYCETIFRLLGAREIQSIDNSSYENATIIHDMNRPLPNDLKGRFSAVFDAGTLEHIFNFPEAIRSCMNMLEVGGFFISITPTNNFMGHGFYQFGPDLFSSIFTRQNGFELVKLVICEAHDKAKWYEVVRPGGDFDQRVELINNCSTLLMCIARKISSSVEPFEVSPQQQVGAWLSSGVSVDNASVSPATTEVGRAQNFKEMLKNIPGVRTFVRNARFLSKPAFPLRYFKPIEF